MELDEQAFIEISFLIIEGYGDIYSTAAVLKASKHKRHYYQSVAMSLVCAVCQTAAVTLVFIDTADKIQTRLEETDFCDADVFWVDRAASSLLCFYLLCYFIQKSRLMWVDGFRYVSSSLKGSYQEYRFINRNIYALGRMTNLLSLILTSAATVLVLFTTTGVINLILFCFALFFLNDLPSHLINFTSQRLNIRFMEKMVEEFESGGVEAIRKPAKEGAKRKGFFFFMLFFGVPILLGSIVCFLFVLVGIVLLPICKL